ncbi:MAG TPA: PIG-L family deacetylase [Verrucomicrobiae bacterium]|nr:PIG-L family deacetylase [Verrucomicrobiae bacterium]
MTPLASVSRLAVSLAIVAAVFAIPAIAAEPVSSAAILQELKSFREMGSVLYVAAHPDDENTLLIAYLARGRNERTAYLSLTRGDGGQNVLGPDFGEKLGVARTQELLAARRLDGGQQFFTRAIDFGFSKDYRETLNIWNEQEVLSDVVRVIREFRPDVIITRFSTQPGGTHGHHTASAVLGLEAFKLAGDPKAFPEQQLAPWQPKRIFVNGRGGNNTNDIRMEISGNDPVLGISFNDLAGRSRAMHKTQGFDNFRGGGGGGARTESFQLLAGDSATNDIMDGVDTTWSRVPGGAEIGKLADEIIAKFDPKNPSASVDALLKLRKNLAAMHDGPLVEEKRKLLDKILQACLGLSVTTGISQADVVPGEKFKLNLSVNLTSRFPVRWMAVRFPATQREQKTSVALRTDDPAVIQVTQTLPTDSLLSQPYWLREEPALGTFRVDDATLIGQPENPPAFVVQYIFAIVGQTLTIVDEPVEALYDSAKSGMNHLLPWIPSSFEARRTLKVIPPVSLHCENEVVLFTPGSSRDVRIEIAAARADIRGELSLDAPDGWKILPAKQSFVLAAVGERKKFNFTVTAPAQSASAKIIASAEIGGIRYRNQRDEISYPHIPRQLLQPIASLKAVSLDLTVRGKRVGYIAGAGDTVADAIKQMGCEVTLLETEDLTTNRLKDFDAVVIGVRAFNVRKDLVSRMPALFDYVSSGGNLIEQYNRPGNDLKPDQLAPYSLKLSGDRVTDENAAMTFLAPDHPVLNTPNKITPADFDGWVQERGIYFPNQWDEHFTPILACNDAGESPLKGGLLVAQYGKGYFVYTGLVFFRELPAGVPGAYRLFANLISLGK